MCYVSSRWAWVLQDALGIAFCLYMLKTVRLPTFKVTDLNHNAIFFFFERFLTVFDCFNKSLIINCVFFCSLMQACTLLMTVLFVYDVFFVFITPSFTKVCQVVTHVSLV